MNDEIEAELKNLLELMSLSEELPIAFPNVEFTPPEGGSGFISADFVFADKRRIGLKNAEELTGRMILVLAMPNNQGSLKSTKLAREISACFPGNLRIPLPSGGHVRVTEGPSIRSGYPDGMYWRTPVVVSFQMLAS